MKKGLPELRLLLSLLPGAKDEEALTILNHHPELAKHPAPLVNCALHGRAVLVETLLEVGADPNAVMPSHEQYRPLHRAIEHRGIPLNPGHLSCVRLLLDAGADPELRSTWMNLTALSVAGMCGDEEMISLLRKYSPEESLFSAAILAEERRVARDLKRKAAAIHPDSNNMTPLHYAALSGMKSAQQTKALADIATLLCDAGADLNSAPKIGPHPSTPVLHFAAWGNNLAVAKVLLERGANPNRGFGNCLWRQPGELAGLFVRHGADINAREAGGKPLLNSRVHWNLTSVVLWLLEKGADPNLKDAEGNTALHEAALRRASPKITEALLRHGAKKNLKNKAGQTPADIARLKKPKP